MISVLKYAFFFGILTVPAYSQNASLACLEAQMNYTACAGENVVLICETSTPEVMWEISDPVGNVVATYYANATTNYSVPQTGDVFTFERIDELNTTVSFDAQYSLNGYTVSCTDLISMTNDTTNVTTTSTDTQSCSIIIPAMPSPPTDLTYSLQGNDVNISWTFLSDPCVMLFTVRAVPDNTSLNPVTMDVYLPQTYALLTLNLDVPYTIVVNAVTQDENVTSEKICIQLTSPTSVSNLTGTYREQQQVIYTTWMAPVYLSCVRPNVTSYNLTHNATDGSTGESGSGDTPVIAMNDTITLLENQTSYTLTNVVEGNVYFVEVIPSNTFGFGVATSTFITATPTTPPTTPPTPTSPTTSEPPTSTGGLSGGAIAGIVIGIVVVVLVAIIIIGVIVYLMVGKRDKHDDGTKL